MPPTPPAHATSSVKNRNVLRERSATPRPANKGLSTEHSVFNALKRHSELARERFDFAAHRSGRALQKRLKTPARRLSVAGQYHLFDRADAGRRHGQPIKSQRQEGEGLQGPTGEIPE